MCGSRKHPYHHQRRTSEILRERGILKAKIFKGMYQPKLEFLEGWGTHTKKTLHGESMDIFWKNTISIRHSYQGELISVRLAPIWESGEE